MPRVTTLQTNFTAGELSPRLAGRTDIDRYANAAAEITNAIPVIHGGAKRRAGTRYVAAAKFAASASRLIPFVFSRDDAYMLEFGHLYLRVFKAGAYLGVEVATSYTAAMLADIDYVQGADTMFLSHPSVPIQRLRRLSDIAWDLSAAPFVTVPFDEQGHTPAVAATLSAATVGTGRTATAAAAAFLPSDVGRVLTSGAGSATVTGYTSTTQVTIDITAAFSGTALASGAWTLDLSPRAIAVPSQTGPVASVITLVGALTRAADLTLSAKTGAITITASSGVFVAGDVGKTIYADTGVVTISGYTSATQVNGSTSSDFAATSYATGGWGITDSVWRADDVGKWVRINGGLLRVTAWLSDVAVKAEVLSELSYLIASPPMAWSIESAVWSAGNGYPRTVALHEQRLITAGTTRFPQTIWGSRTGEYLDFTKGTDDDSAFSFTIASDDVNPIGFLTSARNLLVHTYGGEFSVQGGVEKPLTPTNVRIRPESSHGSKGVRPVLAGRESIFVQRAGRKVRALGYRYDQDGYSAPDLSVLAEHITAGGVTAMAWQQEPDLSLWAVRGDGALLSCTIDRDQGVTGWAKHYTDGAFESVATIPAGDREQTWVIVRRTVSGSTVRYVERLDDTFEPMLAAAPSGYPPLAQNAVFGCTVDCAVSVDNASGQTVFTGLGHLQGKTVAVVADGSVMPNAVVTGGQITLARASKRTLIGLPFTTRIKLLTPELGTGTGSAQDNSMRTSEITLRFLETVGATVYDGEDRKIGDLSFRRLGPAVLDQPPQLFSGLKRAEALGWDRGRSEITIVQDQPLPLHVVAAIRKFQVND